MMVVEEREVDRDCDKLQCACQCDDCQRKDCHRHCNSGECMYRENTVENIMKKHQTLGNCCGCDCYACGTRGRHRLCRGETCDWHVADRLAYEKENGE
jgi:hypothetical protein